MPAEPLTNGVAEGARPADSLLFEGIEIRLVGLSLAHPVGTAAGTHATRPIVFVRMAVGGGEGWGEAGALAEGTAVDPSTDAVWRVLCDHGHRVATACAARDGRLPAASVVGRMLGDEPAERMAGSALEMAVLDATLSAQGTPLASWLGGVRPVVDAGAVVGIPADGDIGALVADVGQVVEAGYPRVRMKIAPGFDVAAVAAVRAAFPRLVLQADANGAYRLDAPGELDDVDRLRALDPLGLACLEQPLPPADLAALAVVAQRLETPVALDESLSSNRRIAHALRYGACEVACLKPARLGGLAAVRRAVEQCAAADVPAFVGGFFESGLGRSSNVAAASLAGFTLAGDLSSPSGYLVENPFAFPVVTAGQIRVPDGPGIGSRPDLGLLYRRTLAVRWLPAH